MAYRYVNSINPSPIRFVIQYEYPSDIFKLECNVTLSVTAKTSIFRIERLQKLFYHLYEYYPRILRKIIQLQDYKGTLQVVADKDFTEGDAVGIDIIWQSYNEYQVEIKFIEFLS